MEDVPRISGQELRERIQRFGITFTEAAQWFGVTRDGLAKMLSGRNPVNKPTRIILQLREQLQNAAEGKLLG